MYVDMVTYGGHILNLNPSYVYLHTYILYIMHVMTDTTNLLTSLTSPNDIPMNQDKLDYPWF